MDISQLQTNVKGRGKQNSGKKNKEIVKREQYKETPFDIVTFNKKSWIGMGNFKLSEEVEDKKILEARIEAKEWWFITTVINTVVVAQLQQRKEEAGKEQF